MKTAENKSRFPTRRDFLKRAAALAGLAMLPAGLRAAGGASAPRPSDGGIFSGPHTPRHPRLIAHRGTHALAPENSLAAFEESGKLGFWAIETDVRRTKDGRLVCHHDATLKKMFGVDARVQDLTYDELVKLPYSRGKGRDTQPAASLRMPLFTEYLEICRKYGCVPFIEIKDDVTAEVIRVARGMKMEERSVISSIKFPHIEAARKESKRVFLHHIFSDEEHMKKLVPLGYAGVSHRRVELDDVSAALIEKTHKAGLRVCLRAGDTRETVLKMLEMGVDYIPTNAIIKM